MWHRTRMNRSTAIAGSRAHLFVGALALLLSACEPTNGVGTTDEGSNPTRISVTTGCYNSSYANNAPSVLGCGLLPSLGDFNLDRQFNEEIGIQGNFWGRFPQVYPFDECPGQSNALSLPSRVILFGRNLSFRTIAQTGSTLPLAGVMAHEWAHQLQFEFGWINSGAPTARPTELEADAFSGFYMGLAKGWAGAQLETYFATLFNLGDYNFNHPGHHGTPQERLAAGALGMQTAIRVLQTGARLSYQDLHQIFAGAIGAAVLEKRAEESDARLDKVSAEGEQIWRSLDLGFIARIREGRQPLDALDTPLVPIHERMGLFPY